MFTYWYRSDRGFANEYDIGIASSAKARFAYSQEGYERIDRKRAQRELIYRGDAATQPMVSVSFDGYHFADHIDRFELSKAIRAGTLPAFFKEKTEPFEIRV